MASSLRFGDSLEKCTANDSDRLDRNMLSAFSVCQFADHGLWVVSNPALQGLTKPFPEAFSVKDASASTNE